MLSRGAAENPTKSLAGSALLFSQVLAAFQRFTGLLPTWRSSSSAAFLAAPLLRRKDQHPRLRISRALQNRRSAGAGNRRCPCRQCTEGNTASRKSNAEKQADNQSRKSSLASPAALHLIPLQQQGLISGFASSARPLQLDQFRDPFLRGSHLLLLREFPLKETAHLLQMGLHIF